MGWVGVKYLVRADGTTPSRPWEQAWPSPDARGFYRNFRRRRARKGGVALQKSRRTETQRRERRQTR